MGRQGPKLKRVALIPDVHAPFEDKRAVALVIKALQAWGVDILVDLGDAADCYTVSSHSKDPARSNKLKDEVEGVNSFLDKLDSTGAKAKYFIKGNHEDRLERYIAEKAPELFGLVGCEELFRLKQRGWSVTQYKDSMKLGKLHLTHDCGNAGGQAHSKALDTFQDNVVIGHTHRMAISYVGNAKGKTHVGAMFGWLGDVKYIDYMHKVSALRAWQLGFGVGYMEVTTGVVHLQAVPIVDYKLVLEGQLYVG